MISLFFRKLSRHDKNKISEAITQAEKNTSGEIRVHLSYQKEESDLFLSAQKQFQKLKMDQTRDRNGILLYLNLRLKKFALYGDQGIHQQVGQKFWDDLSHQIGIRIREKNLCEGIVHAVRILGEALQKHFPYQSADQNELSNDLSES